jgi:Na+-translocating ferredoxin:NAD+ oxidoreductase RnfD subunit
VLAAFAGTILTEIFFLYRRKTPFFPLSGVLSTAAIILIIDSKHLWIYTLIGIISIASKNLFRITKRHIFVPNNIGIVVALLFFGEYATANVGRWGGTWQSLLVIAILGIYVSYKANRLALSFSFIAIFTIGALLRSELRGLPFLTVVAPITGAAFQLFSFFIATDPIVTPKLIRHQIIFGACLAILDGYFRFNQFKYAPFYALLIICAAFSWIEEIFDLERDYPWSINPVDSKIIL